jgi:hypothetical protein
MARAEGRTRPRGVTRVDASGATSARTVGDIFGLEDVPGRCDARQPKTCVILSNKQQLGRLS